MLEEADYPENGTDFAVLGRKNGQLEDEENMEMHYIREETEYGETFDMR